MNSTIRDDDIEVSELVYEIYYWLKERDPKAAESFKLLPNDTVHFEIHNEELLVELKLKFL